MWALYRGELLETSREILGVRTIAHMPQCSKPRNLQVASPVHETLTHIKPHLALTNFLAFMLAIGV